MRLLILFSLLFSQVTLAQLDTGTGAIATCTEDTFATTLATDPSTNTYDCQNVVISNSLQSLNDPSLPLTIRATGEVLISASVIFRGASAIADVAGDGGPGGGGRGGDFTFGVENLSQPIGQGGEKPAAPAGCSVGEAEGSGGGGGSLAVQGLVGKKGFYTTGDGTLEEPGNPGPTTITFDVNNFIFAGAGGGSGEAGCNNGSFFGQQPGAGGGGGGAIRIVAAGDIIVNGEINVSGGSGGIGTGFGGGGGGGSGGIIALQTLSNIILNANLIPSSGTGGGNFSADLNNGDGGAGASGLIMLEDINGINIYSEIVRPPVKSTKSLNSDISCGTIAKANENNNQFFQLIAGFMMAIMFGILIKILSRFQVRS